MVKLFCLLLLILCNLGCSTLFIYEGTGELPRKVKINSDEKIFIEAIADAYGRGGRSLTDVTVKEAVEEKSFKDLDKDLKSVFVTGENLKGPHKTLRLHYFLKERQYQSAFWDYTWESSNVITLGIIPYWRPVNYNLEATLFDENGNKIWDKSFELSATEFRQTIFFIPFGFVYDITKIHELIFWQTYLDNKLLISFIEYLKTSGKIANVP